MSRLPRIILASATLALAGLATTTGRAADAPTPAFHPLFTDCMVLQRDLPAPVWGTAAPGAKLVVTIAGRLTYVIAGSDGRWLATLPPLPAGGPHRLAVASPEGETVLADIFAGDVWLCVGDAAPATAPPSPATAPTIRSLSVSRRLAAEPATDLASSTWQPGTAQLPPASQEFARRLAAELDVPIGLILVPGEDDAPAAAWLSAETLRNLPAWQPALERLQADLQLWREGGESALRAALDDWWRQADPCAGAEPPPADPAFHAADWTHSEQPGAWDEAFDGVVWLRREFDLPEAIAGKAGTLSLGPIGSQERTFLNGQLLGETDGSQKPRRYKVPAKLLKAGANLLLLRVLDSGGPGGLLGAAGQLKLAVAGTNIPLAGTWLHQAGPPAPPMPQRPDGNPGRPTVLFNGRIAPLAPFAIKGILWHQGEADLGRDHPYRQLLPALITDWRRRFIHDGTLPFAIVQLAAAKPPKGSPADSGRADLRAAQAWVTQTIPHCGLAATLDLGDAIGQSPAAQRELGRRLALWALHDGYGRREIVHAGPVCRAAERLADGQVLLHFDHAGSGLACRTGRRLKGFSLAGTDGRFRPATARLAAADPTAVVVAIPEIPMPTAIRYAWSDNPDGNLSNHDGLPALPFQLHLDAEP
ncbi:MAG: sialate O-acetylesterase [Lentisphaeria bacterium]|jgi:sialate O-acetylesterase